MAVYKSDPRYSILISALPPFNILVVPFIPCLLSMTNETKLIEFNNNLSKIFYFPMAVLGCLIFTGMNLLLLPFAWLYLLLNKISIAYRARKNSNVLEVFIWLAFGLFFLFLAVFPDSFYFFIQIY